MRSMRSLWDRLGSWGPLLLSVALCQTLSLLITGTGLTSALLASRGVSLPSSQSCLNYLLLLLFLPVFLYRRHCQGFRLTVRSKWWLYVGLAVCDVEANFLVVLAYQYTYLSSVMLLDCFTIPCVMLLGRFILDHRFSWMQLLGVLICVAGIVALLVSDWTESAFGQTTAPNPILGDVLCLAGAILYAVSNTGQELVVTKDGSKIEYLAMLALFAAPLSVGQSAAVDHATWLQTPWSWQVVGLMLGFAVCLFLIYTMVPVALEREGATFLNLNLLTSDVFAIVAGVYLFGYKFTVLYIVAAVLIVAGLIVYNIRWSIPEPTGGTLEYENVGQPINE